jgi:hypothetical protein
MSIDPNRKRELLQSGRIALRRSSGCFPGLSTKFVGSVTMPFDF